MLAYRVGELIDYQDAALRRAAYVGVRPRGGGARGGARPGRAEVTHAVIRHLYKLMAYKDEYEVARLHLKAAFHAGTRGLFAAPRRLSWHLHPPLLRALGLKRKLRARTLVRGTRSGPSARCGASAAPRSTPSATRRVRREERRLVPWYRGLVGGARRLGPDAHATAVDLARLPDGIRGYEDIKLRSIAAARARETLVGATA